MADQKRWFKLWCSAPSDDDLLNLPPALRWAWIALACYTKEHGTAGIVKISPSNHVLAAQMGIQPESLIETLASLPNIAIGTAPVHWSHGRNKKPLCEGEFVWGSYPHDMRGGQDPNMRGRQTLEEWCRNYGFIVVTWRNWNKYQEDTTASSRGEKLRSKRRGEEKRREEKRREEAVGTELLRNPASTASPPNNSWPKEDHWLKEFLESQQFLVLDLEAVKLLDHSWWDATAESCAGLEVGSLGREFAKMANYLRENPRKRPTARGWRRFIRSWLERSAEWERKHA